MSEQHRGHQEHGESLKPVQHSSEHLKQHHEKELTSAEKQHGTEKHVEELAKAVEQQAVSGKEHSTAEHQSSSNNHPVLVNSHLKSMAFSRAMTRTRKKLSPVSRGFSKVVHIPVVDKSSEFIGKTVARPQAMLWGAVFAFIGTSALLWTTRHFGYEYNYLLAILLFVIGAVIGTALEGLFYIFRKQKD